MKRLYFLLVAAVFMSVSAFAQDKFFKKYADNEKVEYMYVSKEMRGKTSHVKMPGSIYMMGVDSLESLQMLDCSDPVLMKTMLKERGQEVSVMLDLEVPEDELMTRLIKRGQESGRADDNEETIKKRLVVYHSQTAPLIDWYKNDGKYCHINGLGSMDGIFADICAAVDKL